MEEVLQKQRIPHIVLGVTGSIAAHKAIDITSGLVKKECEVRVVMSKDALQFVTQLPFRTLSRNEVVTDFYEGNSNWKPVHIDLADWADLFIIVPATANTIAKIAQGIADNPLTATALSISDRVPFLMAPAMNGRMWQHVATQNNVKILESRGVYFIEPELGLQACGYEGKGRLAAVELIIREVLKRVLKA